MTLPPDFRLRIPASGRPIVGVNPDDVLLWSTAVGGWVVGAQPAGGGCIGSRADLVALVGAPVGGEFRLPGPARYELCNSFALDAGESLRFTFGSVRLVGNGYQITTDAPQALSVGPDGLGIVEKTRFVNTSGNGVVVDSTPTLVMTESEFTCTDAASVALVQDVSIQDCNLVTEQCNFVAGNRGAELSASANNVLNSTHQGSRFEVTDAASLTPFNILDADGTKRVALEGCELVPQTNDPAFRINGNAELIALIGCYLRASANGVFRDSGVIGAAIFNGGVWESTTFGIGWSSANIPANGLLVAGVQFPGVASPFNGFAATDARVNVKACGNSAGLETETAIV